MLSSLCVFVSFMFVLIADLQDKCQLNCIISKHLHACIQDRTKICMIKTYKRMGAKRLGGEDDIGGETTRVWGRNDQR